MRRVVPFLDVWLPKVWAFATGNDSLLICPTAGDADVLREEEVKNAARLGGDREQGCVCGRLSRWDRG